MSILAAQALLLINRRENTEHSAVDPRFAHYGDSSWLQQNRIARDTTTKIVSGNASVEQLQNRIAVIIQGFGRAVLQ